MNTSPEERNRSDPADGHGDFGARTAFDALHVYHQLQQVCRTLESIEEHAAAAYVAQAMSIVHDRFGVGEDHLAVP